MQHFRLRQLPALAKRAFNGWIDDDAPTMGAALAFYTVLSLAPLVLVAVGFAGFFVGREEAQAAFTSQLAAVLGEKAAAGVQALVEAAAAQGEGKMAALVGLVTMMLGATTVFAELRADLDRIWHYKPASSGLAKMFKARFFAFLLVMAIGALLLFSLFATTFLAAVGGWWFDRSPLVVHAIEFFTSFVVITLLFAMIYKILPSRRIAWSDVWVGAAVTSLLFWLGKYLIALYISHAAVDSRFGAAGTLVVVILWVYYSSQVFFLGAEFTREYALEHGSKRHERKGRPLSEMNADYEALVERAKQIVAGKDKTIPSA